MTKAFSGYSRDRVGTNGISAAAKLFVIPSTYAIITWVFTLSLLIIYKQNINEISSFGYLNITYALFCFFLSVALNYKFAENVIIGFNVPKFDISILYLFLLCYVIGGIGLYLYIVNITNIFGGFGSLIYVLYSQDFLYIRKASAEVSTVGVQLSYFSWMAIYLGIICVFRSNLNIYYKIFILLLTIFEIFANLLFIDRTRPIWIFIPILMVFLFGKKHKDFSFPKIVLFLFFLPIGFFIGFSILTGKYSNYGVFDTLYIYLTGSYAYLDAIITEDSLKEMLPVRSLYWLSKIVELFGFDIEVPNQILDPRHVPFWTNVGTFIEPLYSDGGMLYVIILLPALVIGLDRFALMMYHRATYLSLFIWANIVFCSIISFFVPKFNQLPIWLFFAVSIIVEWLKRSSSSNISKDR